MMSTSKFKQDHKKYPEQYQDYPKEVFIPFHDPLTQAPDPVYQGRITLVAQQAQRWVEVDIIFIESKKIYHPVGRKMVSADDEMAISEGMQMLAHFMQRARTQENVE